MTVFENDYLFLTEVSTVPFSLEWKRRFLDKIEIERAAELATLERWRIKANDYKATTAVDKKESVPA